MTPRHPRIMTLTALLVAVLFILTACGGGDEGGAQSSAPEQPGAASVVTESEPTPAEAAPTEAAPTEAAPAAAEGAATEEVTEQATEQATEQPAEQATDEAAASEGMTETAEVAAGQEMTGTEEAAASEGMTETAEVAAGQEITGTEGVAASEAMTGTGETAETAETAADAPMLGIREAQGHVVSVSDLLGHNMTNLNGEGIGEIEDLVINLASGRVMFLTLGYGGLLDLGEKIFPIPLPALRYAPTEEGEFDLTLNVAEETLQTAPGFDATWPDVSNPNFDREVEGFWRSLDEPALARGQRGMGVRAVAGAAIKASNLLGRNVQNYEGEDIGTVVDMLLDLGSGEVRYLVLSFGGFLGIGDNLYAVPLRAFSADPRGLYGEGGNTNLLADIDEPTLEQAPSFAADAYPDMQSEGWDADVQQFWNGLLGIPATRTGTGAVALGEEQPVDSGEVSAGDAMTDTATAAGMTATPAAEEEAAAEATGTPDLAATDEMTGTTAGASATPATEEESAAEATETPDVAATDEMTGTAAGADTTATPEAEEEPAGATETLAAAGTQELTGTAAAGATAAVTGTEEMTGTGAVDTAESAGAAGVAGTQGQAALASDLLGMTVFNADGDAIGEIEELIISLTEGRIAFVTMGYGGLLDLGESIFPLPLNALRYDGENNGLIFNVDEATLESAPAFDANWPDLTDPDYDRDLRSFWNTVDLPAVERSANLGGVRSIGGTLIRGSRMIGANVRNSQGEDVGEIQDMIVELGSGDVRYAILSFGGFLGLGEKWFAFPLDEMTITGEALYAETNALEDLLGVGPELILDVDPAALENAPGFDAGSLPDLSDPAWEDELRRFWNPDLPGGTEDVGDGAADGGAEGGEATGN